MVLMLPNTNNNWVNITQILQLQNFVIIVHDFVFICVQFHDALRAHRETFQVYSQHHNVQYVIELFTHGVNHNLCLWPLYH